MMIIRLALVLFLAHYSVAASTTAFLVNDDLSCSGNLVSVSDLSIDCGGDNLCELGDKMDVSGTITLGGDLPEKLNLEFKACFLGMKVFCTKTFYENNFDLCEKLGMQSQDGAACPSAGEYSFQTAIDLPGDSRNLASGWSATVYTTVSDPDGSSSSFTCTNSIKARKSQSMSWTNAIVGVSLLTIAASVAIRRKRRIASLDLSEGHGAENTGNFELMAESGVKV